MRPASVAPSVAVSRLGPAITWLRDHGVSVDRLAAVFGTTALNIRQIDFRQRRNSVTAESATLREKIPTVRDEEDASAASIKRTARVHEIQQQADALRREHVVSGRYLEAVKSLKRLQVYCGFPSSLDWLRVVGMLHRERAWFLVHSGRTAAALGEITRAIAIAERVYDQARKPAPLDAKDIVDAALIKAHAHLMRHEPTLALEALQLVEDASEAANLPLGSDYHRQRGVVLLQAGVDDTATSYFRKAGRRMRELGEGSHPLAEAITNDRYVSLLTRSFDQAQELAVCASATFGGTSMEASVAVHWAAACALSTDSPAAQAAAGDLLVANEPTATQFGHQATLAFLLRITTDLNLPLDVQRAWIRQALYINAADR